jgi:hypothetical protein
LQTGPNPASDKNGVFPEKVVADLAEAPNDSARRMIPLSPTDLADTPAAHGRRRKILALRVATDTTDQTIGLDKSN